MSTPNTIIDLALNLLRGPMHPNPTTTRDKLIPKLQVKYRTYFVEFDINEGAIMLPKMFARDFGNEVRRFATLVDPLGNQFQVLVEKIKGNVYLTWGWFALKDFYNITVGAWVILLYTGLGSFGIILKDRLGNVIDPPPFVPPIKFKIDLSRVGTEFVDDLPESTELLSYEHHGSSFGIHYEKKLTYYDITTGFLILSYEDFGEKALHKTTTTMNLIDDCGNKWDCVLIYTSFPYKHFKLGGEWKRLVAARRLEVDDHIKVSRYIREENDDIYLNIYRIKVGRYVLEENDDIYLNIYR